MLLYCNITMILLIIANQDLRLDKTCYDETGSPPDIRHVSRASPSLNDFAQRWARLLIVTQNLPKLPNGFTAETQENQGSKPTVTVVRVPLLAFFIVRKTPQPADFLTFFVAKLLKVMHKFVR